MTMHVYIPTYRRTERQKTFGFIPIDWRPRTTLVVDEQDARVLRRLTDGTGTRLLIHPPEVRTIAQKRAWIIRQSKEEKIVMFDDDLYFDLWDFTGEKPRSQQCKPKDVGVWLGKIEKKLDDYAHVGLGPRQNNNQHAPGGWHEDTRMMYALAYRPAVLMKNCELGRIETREDFDLTLQLLRKGFSNAVSRDCTVGQSYGNPGGASEERTLESSDADALKLAELHAPFVKVVDKEYKAGSPARKEVIVYWKKAAEAGRY